MNSKIILILITNARPFIFSSFEKEWLDDLCSVIIMPPQSTIHNPPSSTGSWQNCLLHLFEVGELDEW